MTTEGNDPSSEEPRFTFHDKRRVDPTPVSFVPSRRPVGRGGR